MGKAIRNTDQQTVSSKDDVLSLLGAGDDNGGGDQKQKRTKPEPGKPTQSVGNKEDVLDLLSGTVKKKDTDAEPSATPSSLSFGSVDRAVSAFQNKTLTADDVDVLSKTDQGVKMGLNILSPKSKEIYATAHNGPKKADMVTSMTKLIDQYYPPSQDPNQNHQRGQILQSVWSGDQTAISNLKNGIVNALQKKIDARSSEIEQSNRWNPAAKHTQAAQVNSDETVVQLRKEQEDIKKKIDDYGKMHLASSKDMEAWFNLDKQHPNIQTSIAAEKLGKMVEEKYGIDKTSPNKEYDRMRTGFDLIIKDLQMDVNEALAYGIPTKNQELIKKAQDKLQTLARYRELYDRLDTDQFPDVGLDKTARYLGDIIAEKHPNKLIRTKEDVREAGRIAEDKNPGFLDKYGKFVDVAAEKQGQGTFIPRGGGALNEVIGGLMTSSAKSEIDLLKWKDRALGATDEEKIGIGKEGSAALRGTTQSRTEPTKIVYDKEGKAYREVPNENYGTLPWNNFYRFAGENIPGLLEFIATEGAAKAGTQALTYGRASKNATQLAGLIGASYITSYNSNREFADANIDDPTSYGEAKKMVAANFLTLANAGVFHLMNASPSKMVESAISKNVMPEVIELFEKNNWEKLSEKTTEGFLKENLVPRIKAVVTKFAESAGSGSQMGLASVFDQRLKDLVGAISNTKYKPSTIEDNARAFVQQGIMMTALGLPGMVRTGLVPHSAKEALHQAGLYAPQYIDMINERMNNGELDPHQAAGMISIVKTMNEELVNAATQLNDEGTPLTTRQQRDIAIANFRKRSAAAMEENGQEVKASTEPDKEIKDIKKENNWQAIEETPTFKSITEVDESGKKGGKVGSMADIDPVKQYNYEKEGVDVTESGADLINHLETGDIYEREKTSGDEAKVAKTEEAPAAEGEDKKSGEDKDKTPVTKQTSVTPLAYDAKKALREGKKKLSVEVDEGGERKVVESDFDKEDAGLELDRMEGMAKKDRLKWSDFTNSFFGQNTDTGTLMGAKAEFEKDPLKFIQDFRESLGRDENKPTVEAAVIQIGDKTYEGKNHGEAIEKAAAAGEDVSGVNREKDGKFRTSDGRIITREEAKAEFGGDHSHELIPQEPSKEAARVVGEAIKEGKIADNLVEHVQKDPEQFLSDVADQALGYTRQDGERVKSPYPAAEKAAREQFGDKVVDAAIKMFPEKADSDNGKKVPRSTFSEEGQNSTEKQGDTMGGADVSRLLTEQKDALQGRYDRLIAGGADPNDSEMQALKARIDSLSSSKTENNGNVKDGQVEGRQEGSDAHGQEGGQEKGGQKEGVLTPESDGGGGMTKEGPPLASESKNPVVGIRDSIVNADRIHRGLQPLVKEFVRTWGSNWNDVKRRMARGFSPRNFIEDTAAKLARGKRIAFNDNDYAVLLFDRLNIQNDIARAQDVLKEAMQKTGEEGLGAQTAAQDILDHYNRQLEQNDVVARALKSESGRALAAIQMMSKMNGELVRWSEDISQYYRGEPPRQMKEFVERIEKEYKEKSQQLQEHYEKLLKKAADDAFEKAKKEQPKPSAGKSASKSTKAKGKDLADKIRNLRLGGKGGTAQANVFGLPIAVYDTALVAIANAVEAGASLVDAIQTALKDVKFDRDEDRNAFMSHLQNVEDPERPEAKRAGYLADLKSISEENSTGGLVRDAVKPLRELMKSYIKDGSVKSLDDLVKKVHDDVKDFMPNADERDIRDAFSGYGLTPDSEGRIKSDITKLKEQAKAVSVYQDLLQRPTGETPAQEAKRLGKAAEMRKKVEEYMQSAGIDEEPPVASPEAKKALALERSKKRTQQIINDLNRQILAGERKQRNNITPDHELDVLRAEKKRLTDQLNEIDKADVPVEEKLKRTEDALNRQVSNYERQIKEGLDPLRPKEDRPTTKRIEELRERKKALKGEIDKMRAEMNPKMDPAQLALIRYNESLARQIKNLDEKIANKDYETEEDKKVDFSRDTVSLALEARLKKLQSDFYATKRVAEAVNKGWIKKLLSLLATTKRAFVLSRISTFGRLIGAVAWNTVFEAGETAQAPLQYAGTKVGFGKKINAIAERYGVGTLEALKSHGMGEIAAVKAVTSKSRKTWLDFVSDAKNGYSELSLMYGHGQEYAAIPKEARDTWQNIEHGLEAFGRGHGAVKGVFKRMEFERSYVIRKEALRRKGEDVNNPVIQQAIGAMAYQDALRGILMEDNWLSGKYQKAIQELQKGGFGANILALTLQEMMPIVKIPTNLVLNAGRSTLGTPLAGGYIAVRGLIDIVSKGKSEYGISKLSVKEADAVLRNLRKGNLGMALMVGGFFAPSMFGASHYYLKGTQQPDDLEEGEVKFFGLIVPKWLADNPYLVTMKIGASLRNAFDYYSQEEGDSDALSAVRSFKSTGFSALEETPIFGTPAELLKVADGRGGDWFWYNQIKSTLEPGLLQEIAEDTDNRDGWYNMIGGDRIKRKPKSVGEALKTGVPGLRQDVDEK